MAALLGSAGQAPYAAANGGLDGLAAVWSRAGSPVASLQWGAWAGAGMAARDAATAARVQRTGMELLVPDQALAALGGLIGRAYASFMPSNLAAVPFQWPAFLRSLPGAPPALFSAFVAEEEPAGEQMLLLAAPGCGTRLHAPAVGDIAALVADAMSSIVGRDVSEDEPLMAAGTLKCNPK